MHSTLEKWLNELEDEIQVITSTNINEEAHSNMVTFGFNEQLLEDWGRESVLKFLSSCSDLYNRKSMDFQIVFYSWFDEQAGQIRISAVSQSHGKLPFRCKYTKASISDMVAGLYNNDSGLFSSNVLNVWHQNI